MYLYMVHNTPPCMNMKFGGGDKQLLPLLSKTRHGAWVIELFDITLYNIFSNILQKGKKLRTQLGFIDEVEESICQRLHLKWDTKTYYVYSQGQITFNPPLGSNRKYAIHYLRFLRSFISLIQWTISIIKSFDLLHLPPLLHAPLLFYFGCLVDVSTKKASTIEVWSLTFGARSIANKVQSTLCYRETIIDSSTCYITLVMFPRFTFVWCCRV